MKRTINSGWKKPIMAALAACAAIPLWLPVAASAQSSADATLSSMREAFRRNDSAALERALPQLRGHVLESLAAYWTAKAQLTTATPERIRQTLTDHQGTYWEDRLRNDWLLQLGERGEWALFDEELPRFRMQDDRQVQCYAAWRAAQTGQMPWREAATTVHALWMQQRTADTGCAAAAKALHEAGHLSTTAVWQRARWGVELGRGPVASQAVSIINRSWVPLLDTVMRNPAQYLDNKVTAVRPRTKELVTLAIIHLADKSPDAAADALDDLRWRTQLTREERSWAWGAIGRSAAQSRQDNALAYFERGQREHMHTDHLVWQARAALRAQQWATMLETVQSLPAELQNEPTWVYWRAHALNQRGAKERAQALWQSIASNKGFYEQLALESLGQRITAPPAPPTLSASERAAADKNPGLRRALAAIEQGLRSEGVREWNYTIGLHQPGGMNDRELLAAAELACQREIWDRCINTSERTRTVVHSEQRFPMPFRDSVLARSRDIGLDPAYVYGLIRQESRFIMDARSHVGASGLMQVMPATARWTARKIGMTDFQPHQITERETNIRIGTAYLKLALDDLDGSMPMAAAAYNAGPNRPRAWRNGPQLPAEAWAENIPFDETRDYVKKVLANTVNYAALITGQPQSLRERLGTVGPRVVNTPINTELP
jgi:soluble lytic murein transglycosylase